MTRGSHRPVLTPPPVVWHGTRRVFDRFDSRLLGTLVLNPTTAAGFWFTDRREGAEYWSLRRPTAPGSALRREGDEPVILRVALRHAGYGEIAAIEFTRWLQTLRRDAILRKVEEMKGLGMAGIAVRRASGETWFCAFDPADAVILSREPAVPARPDPAPEEADDSPSP